MDRLPADVRARFEPALVGALTREEIARAFHAATALALEETQHVDATLAGRLGPVMAAMTESWRAST
jgi:hypothetical protein